MKDISFETKLTTIRPDNSGYDKLFTDRVMRSIERSEIFSHSIRRMNVNHKETFIMKLKHLPLTALVALIIAVIAAVSGTAYAVIQTLSPAASITSTGTNQYGRKQVTASFTNCGDYKLTEGFYEVRKGSTISDEDIAKVLQAHCEIKVITEWAKKNASNQRPGDYIMIGDGPGGVSLKIKSISDSDLAVTSESDTALTASIASNAKYLENNNEVPKHAFKPGDIVTFVTMMGERKLDHLGTATALFKLSLPQKYYDSLAKEFTIREPCKNNPSVSCIDSDGDVTILSYGGGMPSIDEQRPVKTLQGKLRAFDDTTITLNTQPNKEYTVHIPWEKIKQYKNNKGQLVHVNVGDAIEIYYFEDMAKQSTVIEYEDLTSVSLMTEKLTPYSGSVKY